MARDGAVADLTFERFLRLGVRETLESVCCEPLQFMWDNSLLAPRDQWAHGHDADGVPINIRQLVGFRVVRQFWFLKRDQVLYVCPFCRTELVAPLGYTDGERYGALMLQGLTRGDAVIDVSKTLLRRELAITKRRNRAGWPPKD